MTRFCAILAALALTGAAAHAQEVAVESHKLGRQQITLHLQPFLTEEELATLRVVATMDEALQMFIDKSGRHAAMAVAPAEGFIRQGQPVASASARSGLRNAEAARAAALAACNEAKSKGADCVVVLEVAPAR